MCALKVAGFHSFSVLRSKSFLIPTLGSFSFVVFIVLGLFFIKARNTLILVNPELVIGNDKLMMSRLQDLREKLRKSNVSEAKMKSNLYEEKLLANSRGSSGNGARGSANLASANLASADLASVMAPISSRPPSTNFTENSKETDKNLSYASYSDSNSAHKTKTKFFVTPLSFLCDNDKSAFNSVKIPILIVAMKNGNLDPLMVSGHLTWGKNNVNSICTANKKLPKSKGIENVYFLSTTSISIASEPLYSLKFLRPLTHHLDRVLLEP